MYLLKIKMQRVIPLRQYKGSVELVGHELPYSLDYIPTNKEDIVDSQITWYNVNEIFNRVYDEIRSELQDIFREQIIQHEARLNILNRKMNSGLGATVSGGSFSSSEDKGDSNTDMKKVQVESEHKVKISKDLENILKNTPLMKD